MLSRKIICKSYFDRVQYETHNSIFYIYYLGRYNNKSIFHYGETQDLYGKEFLLKQKLPIYNKLKAIPIEHNVYGKEKFDNYLKTNKLRIIFPIDDLKDLECFTTSSQTNIKDILLTLNNLYKDVSVT